MVRAHILCYNFAIPTIVIIGRLIIYKWVRDIKYKNIVEAIPLHSPNAGYKYPLYPYYPAHFSFFISWPQKKQDY
jgi:hypothetical protein